jgi:hypothetical protein
MLCTKFLIEEPFFEEIVQVWFELFIKQVPCLVDRKQNKILPATSGVTFPVSYFIEMRFLVSKMKKKIQKDSWARSP